MKIAEFHTHDERQRTVLWFLKSTLREKVQKKIFPSGTTAELILSQKCVTQCMKNVHDHALIWEAPSPV